MSNLTAAAAFPHAPTLSFVDVREEAEYAAGHIPGAVLLPLSVLRKSDAALPLGKDTPYVVYCQAGVRSAMAIALLQQQGFTQLTNLSDGYSGWLAAQKAS